VFIYVLQVMRNPRLIECRNNQSKTNTRRQRQLQSSNVLLLIITVQLLNRLFSKSNFKRFVLGYVSSLDQVRMLF
jgi:hypothetical protein